MQRFERGQPLCLQRIRSGAAQGGAVQDRIHRLRPVLQKARQDFVAQLVARQAGVAVGRIVDAIQPLYLDVIAQLLP